MKTQLLKGNTTALIALMLLFEVAPCPVSFAEDRDRSTTWSATSYDGVTYRFITSYLGQEQWSSYPNAYQLHNGNSYPVDVIWVMRQHGEQHQVRLRPGEMTDKTAMSKDDSIKSITVKRVGGAAADDRAKLILGTWNPVGWRDKKIIIFYSNGTWAVQKFEGDTPDSTGRRWRIDGNKLIWQWVGGTDISEITKLTSSQLMFEDSADGITLAHEFRRAGK